MEDEVRPGVVVIGGGPAGLRAAEVLAQDGCRVSLFEQKPSVGRKFLVAGRGGLNLTHSEPLEDFTRRYEDELPRWQELLADFGPAELRAWAEGLGVETYVGTSGRVFPRGQQAAVLLRRWVTRLRELGVAFHVNHRFVGLKREASKESWALDFQNVRDDQSFQVTAQAVIIALGGTSWPQTGSDGNWREIFENAGVEIAPWQAANCGYEVAWNPKLLTAAEGLPLKNISLNANGKTVAGEALITRYGLEGGAIYQLGRQLRAMVQLSVQFDLKPAFSKEQLLAKLPRGEVPFAEIIRRWRLGPAAAALLEHQRPMDAGTAPGELADWVKAFSLPLLGPRPIAEAISSAGGVAWPELTSDLMLHRLPGLFAAGEMINWEAPTGGYLLQGCFATGARAAQGALDFLRAAASSQSQPR